MEISGAVNRVRWINRCAPCMGVVQSHVLGAEHPTQAKHRLGCEFTSFIAYAQIGVKQD